MPYTDADTLPIKHVKRSEFGKPKVQGILVAFLVHFENNPDWPVERVLEEYGLTKGQLYAAWSYYYDHKEEIDAQVKEGQEMVRRYQAEQEVARAAQEA